MKYEETKKSTKYEARRNKKSSILQTSDFTLQKGVSLYLALIIMFILIAIGLGVSLIIVSQMKMMKGMGDSVVALYAADTGIENSLYNSRRKGETGEIPGPVPLGDADYSVTQVTGEDRWRSVGTFKQVKRAIEITIPVPPPELITWTESCNDPKPGGSCGGGTQCVVDGTNDCTIAYFCTPPSPWCPDRDNATLDPEKTYCSSNETNVPCLCKDLGGGFYGCVHAAAPACVSTGQCTYECEPGYFNCNNIQSDGCESSTYPCP